jgi:anti-sigma regulatory factor (Ser/Thr protein kinase)
MHGRFSRHFVSTAAEDSSAPRWRQIFPGDERQLDALRRWITSLLPDCAAREDVITVAVECATNAVKHTASGQDGWFAVEITRFGRFVRVAVADCGAETEPQITYGPQSGHGRGLMMVRVMSARAGVSGNRLGRVIWAEIPWAGDDAAGSSSLPEGHEAAIREREAALEERFAGVPTWFGRFTQQWWAMPGPLGAEWLIEAGSAEELAAMLEGATQARRELAPAASWELSPQVRQELALAAS